MHKVTIPPLSSFIGHGYVQRAGAGWIGTCIMLYRTYIAPEENKIKDAI